MTEVGRFTLPNGLRVLLQPQPGAARVAVSVHYGVGFRSEPPGRAGFAHLFEHLMFRGSASLPGGRFYDHIHRLGGYANGTTHHDYTDYYQVVPAAAVERALFSEADRMRAPLFTAESLDQQIRGVAQEIHQAMSARPYGGFPWPLLSGVLFQRFASAHDGYGSPDKLRKITPADCREFFDAHYAPANAVLTVVGSCDPSHVTQLIEQHFGDIPPRAVLRSPDLDEPGLTADRWMTCTEPAIPTTAVAMGYQVPGDVPGYLAHAVLAALVSRHGPSGLQAGCGFFGPLDAKDPDVLVITVVLPSAAPAGQAVAAVRDQWSRWADRARDGDLVDHTVRFMAVEHHKLHSDVGMRCRALGRFELLFGHAELMDELPGLLADVYPHHVAEAAHALRAAPAAVLAMVPGPRRTRPRDGHAELAEGQRCVPPPLSPPVADLEAGRAGPRPVPPVGTQHGPGFAGLRMATLGNGLSVVAVRDSRTPVVEIRLRLPLSPLAIGSPDEVDALVAGLAAQASAAVRAVAIVGEFQVSTQGQWLDVSGWVDQSEVDNSLVVLADLVTSAGPVYAPVRSRRPMPERTMDEVVRRRWDGGTAEGTHADPPYAVLRQRGAVFVAVGDCDPDRLMTRVNQAMSSWAAVDCPDVLPRAQLAVSELIVLLAERIPDVRLTVSMPEPAGDTGDPARFVATAVFGGYFGSRLAIRHDKLSSAGYEIFAGRDVLFDRPRAYVRARLPRDLGTDIAAGISAEMRRISVEPPTAAEVEAAREFCAGQVLEAFDSPAALASTLVNTVAAGRSPMWLLRLPDMVRAVPVRDVATAAADLFAARPATIVALGNVDQSWASGFASSWHPDMAVRALVIGNDDRTQQKTGILCSPLLRI